MRKEYYLENKEEINKKTLEYYEANKDEINTKRKARYLANKELFKARDKEARSKESYKEYRKQYLKENREKINAQRNEYRNKRRQNDPLFKLKENFISNVNTVLKKHGYTKRSRTHELLGCSYEDFKAHIESLWEPWMTWENRGLYEKDKYNIGWDIDHIIPTSSADTEEELLKLLHYTNLQPLCSKVNRDEKKARLV